MCIRDSSKDDEDGDEYDDDSETITNDLENHMKLLEVFLSLYLKEITQYQMALLKQEIEELYLKFDITWDTDVSKLKNTDFPLFKDLHQPVSYTHLDVYKRQIKCQNGTFFIC